MTAEVIFGTLADVSLREAWAHEAHRFTPWLATNLDRLSQAIGLPLELTGTEITVGKFSADILARNPADNTNVLIENQLEVSDHTHLGQIMTYLAGLSAQTMVWIAPSFREEHLSAIRWLNEHTVEPFTFFAVRLRVVRIENSPFAPLFEVIERPNNWDRQLAAVKRESAGELTELGKFRLDFWSLFSEIYPGGQKAGGASSQWMVLPGTDARLVLYIAQKSVGVFVRTPAGGDVSALHQELNAVEDALSAAVGVPMGEGSTIFGSELRIDMQNRDLWPGACKWLHETSNRYVIGFQQVLGEPE